MTWYQIDYDSDDIKATEELTFEKLGYAFKTKEEADQFVSWRKDNPSNKIIALMSALGVAARKIEVLQMEVAIRDEALRLVSKHFDLSEGATPFWVESMIRAARK